MKSSIRKTVAALVIASTASMSVSIPAYADLGVRAAAQRQLITHGVSASDAPARVAAMTDQEAAALARQLDEMPAGAGGGGGALVFAVGVLLFIAVLPYVIAGGVLIAALKSPGRTGVEAAGGAENP